MNISSSTFFNFINESIYNSLSRDSQREVLYSIMTGAKQQLQEIDAVESEIVVSLIHPRFGTVDVGVSHKEVNSKGVSYLEIAHSVVSCAVKKAAKTSINPESFETFQEYETALQRREKTFSIVSLFSNKDSINWTCFIKPEITSKITVTGHDKAEAEFQAKWTHIFGEYGDQLNIENFSDFLSYYNTIEIADLEPEPVSLLSLAHATLSLMRNIESSELNEPISEIKSTREYKEVQNLLENILRIKADKSENEAGDLEDKSSDHSANNLEKQFINNEHLQVNSEAENTPRNVEITESRITEENQNSEEANISQDNKTEIDEENPEKEQTAETDFTQETIPKKVDIAF